MDTRHTKIIFQAVGLALACLVAHPAFSQDELTELTVDRPGFADTPFTVPKGVYQFEFGFDYYRRPTGELYNLPIGLFRTGISKRMELRVGSKAMMDHTDGNSYKGITPLSLGIKSHVYKQNKGVPEIDLMVNVVLPMNASAYQSNQTGFEFLLLFQNDFYPNTAINYNVGYVWDHIHGRNVFTASFCFNYLPTRRLGLFLEYYGFVAESWPGENGIDGGFTFLLIPSIQLDLSSGVSRLNGENNFFTSTGITFRF